jgi:flagellar motor switch protein FliN/FliY
MEPGTDPISDSAELPVPVDQAGEAESVELAELAPPADEPETGAGPAAAAGHDLTAVLDVPVELAVEIGRTRMTIRDTLGIAPGSLIALDRVAGEPVDLLVNGRRIARGEVVAIDEEFGLRVTEVVSPELRLDAA